MIKLQVTLNVLWYYLLNKKRAVHFSGSQSQAEPHFNCLIIYLADLETWPLVFRPLFVSYECYLDNPSDIYFGNFIKLSIEVKFEPGNMCTGYWDPLSQ